MIEVSSKSLLSDPVTRSCRKWIEVSELNWPAIFLMYSILALISTGTAYSMMLTDRLSRPFYYPLIWELTGHYIAFALAPLLVLGFGALPIRRSNWLWAVPVHILISIGFGIVQTLLMGISRKWIYELFGLGVYDYGAMKYRFIMEYHKQFLSYWTIYAGLRVWAHYRISRERERQAAALELKASELQRQLAQVQLQALRAQLNPHFLFNTLNMVSSVMYEDAERADRMIAALSRMLRMALEENAGERVPMRHELEFVECSAALLKARFQDRIDIDIQCADNALDVLIPNLILHTLIENAVKHHPGGRDKIIHVRARVELDGPWLIMCVEDNGPGIENVEKAMSQGVGLRNTKQRLRALYVENHRFEFVNRPEGGLRVRVAFPVAIEPVPAPA